CWVPGAGCWVPGAGCWVPGARCIVLVLFATAAHAQTAAPPAPRPHHATVAVGASWAGTYSVGETNATLRTNAMGAAPVPFTLFSTSSSIAPAAGVLLRAGFALTRAITIEGGGGFSQPSLTAHVSQDAEQAAAMDASERLQQFVIDAGVVWHLPVHVGSRTRLFAAGGGGYLRQLHRERTLVETGRVYYAGAGVDVWLRGGHGPSKSLGIRSDARINWRRNGIEFEQKTRAFPTLSVLLVLGL
ncbi:MAG: hypothetical protein ABI665_28655, partial [Vicinamibacterales bacterium]